MFTELYVEALLADENSADQVWELWTAAVITDDLSVRAWCILVASDPIEESPNVWK